VGSCGRLSHHEGVGPAQGEDDAGEHGDPARYEESAPVNREC
jgi:hypothetical protein